LQKSDKDNGATLSLSLSSWGGIMGRVRRLGRGNAKRVRKIKWTLRQIISLTLLLATFAAGCIELALWLKSHPIPE
jgi:hypothetical protein